MRVVYVSYDGALDPLGSSQIRPYLEGLSARGVATTLVSFEKPARWRDDEARMALASRLERAGIHWRPLAYHKWPRLPATAWDVLAGARAVQSEVERSGAALVHCRGDVATAMARRARLPRGVRILYVADPATDAALLLARQPGCFVVPPGDGAAAERGLRQALETPRVARDLEAYTRRALAAGLAGVLDDACR